VLRKGIDDGRVQGGYAYDLILAKVLGKYGILRRRASVTIRLEEQGDLFSGDCILKAAQTGLIYSTSIDGNASMQCCLQTFREQIPAIKEVLLVKDRRCEDQGTQFFKSQQRKEQTPNFRRQVFQWCIELGFAL